MCFEVSLLKNEFSRSLGRSFARCRYISLARYLYYSFIAPRATIPNKDLKRLHYIYVLTPQMDAFQRNRIPTITLDVRISCDTFWNYKFNVPIRINDYYNQNDRNINRGDHGRHYAHDDDDDVVAAAATETCRIGNIGRRDPLFCRLEEYLVDYVIQHIYDDLIATRQHRDLPLLLKKARKFHIHGRTLEDLLFPANSGSSAMPENIVYVCTHC